MYLAPDSMTPLLLTLPWLGVLAFLLFVTRVPRELPDSDARAAADAPFVSVIVPARDEALNIEACVGSLTASTYPAFEVIVVDDGSEDGTGRRARSMSPGNARRLHVIDGEELPPGWLGKPWACRQGAAAAGGELLLFTDADTIHGPEHRSRTRSRKRSGASPRAAARRPRSPTPARRRTCRGTYKLPCFASARRP